MALLAEGLGVVSMRICATPPDAVWPGTIWEVYAPPEQGGVPPLLYRRSIGASNDGGRWTFDQSGRRAPATLVERGQRWPDPPREFGLEEVRAGLPWKRTV
jgi:hypothetical protein